MSEARKLHTVDPNPSTREATDEDDAARPAQRHKRFQSHALIDVRTSRWNPFAVNSAVLLDMSERGFKVEFVNPVRLRPGARLRIAIPLSPFGILSPSKLRLEVELKWFDAGSLRAGGVFTRLGQSDAHVVEKIIVRLAEMHSARDGL